MNFQSWKLKLRRLVPTLRFPSFRNISLSTSAIKSHNYPKPRIRLPLLFNPIIVGVKNLKRHSLSGLSKAPAPKIC